MASSEPQNDSKSLDTPDSPPLGTSVAKKPALTKTVMPTGVDEPKKDIQTLGTPVAQTDS